MVVSGIMQRLPVELVETCLDAAETFLVVEELRLLVPLALVLVGIGVSPVSRPSVRSWASDAWIGFLGCQILLNDDEVVPASVVAEDSLGSRVVKALGASSERGYAPAGSVAVIAFVPHDLDQLDLALAVTLPPLSRSPTAPEPLTPLHGT